MPALVTGNRRALHSQGLRQLLLGKAKAVAVVFDLGLQGYVLCVVFHDYFSRGLAVVNNFFIGAGVAEVLSFWKCYLQQQVGEKGMEDMPSVRKDLNPLAVRVGEKIRRLRK